MAPVYEALTSKRTRVLSLDVFDTLVWRTVRKPTDVFHLLGHVLAGAGVLAPGVRPSDFAGARAAAEHEARIKRQDLHGDTEVNIYEIYDHMPTSLFAAGPTLATLVDHELQVEAGVLVPTISVLQLIEFAKSRRIKLALVSDTYIPSELLAKLLSTVLGTDLRFDVLLTSSDYRRNKSGGLFSDLLAAVSSPPESIVHLGDNFAADVDSSRKLGIRAFHLRFDSQWLAAIYDREQKYIEARASIDIEKSAMHATIHKVRSEALNSQALSCIRQVSRGSTEGRTPERDNGAGTPSPGRAAARSHGLVVVGPVLTGFSEWVVRRCSQESIAVALCPLREGKLLAPLLSRTARYLGSVLEARELAVNRSVLLRAQLAIPDRKRVEEALIVRGSATVSEACDLLGLGDVPRLFGDHRNSRLSDPVVRARLLDALTGDAELVDAIRSAGLEARDAVLRELTTACGDLERSESVALVDLGWGATIQRLLRTVAEDVGMEIQFTGFYLATNRNSAKLMTREGGAGERCFGWLSTLGAHPGAEGVLRCPELLEQVCTAPWRRPNEHKEARSHDEAERNRGSAVGAIPDWQRFEAKEAIEGVTAFQQHWAHYASMCGPHRLRLDRAHEVCLGLLLRAIEAPMPVEVQTLGRWLHDEGRRSHSEPIAHNTAFAAYYSAPDLEGIPMEDLYWPWGSAAHADPELPRLIAIIRSGAIDPDLIHPPLETGPVSLRAFDAEENELCSDTVRPRRNHRGLSYARLAVRAPAIAEVELIPASAPCVIRLDKCTLNLTVQGSRDDVSWRLTDLLASSRSDRLALINTVHLGSGVLLCHNYQPIWRINVAALHGAVCSTAELTLAFSVLPIPELLQTLEPHTRRPVPAIWDMPTMERRISELDALIADITGSLSWRLTSPLRKAKALLRHTVKTR